MDVAEVYGRQWQRRRWWGQADAIGQLVQGRDLLWGRGAWPGEDLSDFSLDAYLVGGGKAGGQTILGVAEEGAEQ